MSINGGMNTRAKAPKHQSLLVSLVAFDGVDDLDFFGAWSVLYKAQQASQGEHGQVEVVARVISLEDQFRTASGLVVNAEHACQQSFLPPKAVLVPGGEGVEEASSCRRLLEALVRMRAEGTRFYTICTGSVLLGSAGILKDMRVSVHKKKQALLASFGCQVVSGLHEHDWLTSIGGVDAPNVKSVAIAFRVLEDICPLYLASVRSRMEIGSEIQ
jgi:transcriptional regulator GlxA family with amidase domain